MSELTVAKIRKLRHQMLHQADGVYYVFKDRTEFSPYTNQPPCEECGKPRGTPIDEGDDDG